MKTFLDRKAKQVNVLDERFYTLDNKTFYPSVTTVLQTYPKGSFFEKWLMDTGRNAETIKKEAGIQGTNVHNAIEQFLKGATLTLIGENGDEYFTLNEWKMICRFMDFWDYEGINRETMEVEQILFSKKMKLGGTGDLVVEIDNENWFIDYKTSNAMHKTYRIQLAIYKKMWEEMNPGRTIDKYGVLWLNAKTRTKKGFMQGNGWQIKDYTDHFEQDMKLYDSVRRIWDEENPVYKPQNMIFPNEFKLKK
jgi:ATP-dependent exoDNAse (exonuclease V) beta subunit